MKHKNLLHLGVLLILSISLFACSKDGTDTQSDPLPAPLSIEVNDTSCDNLTATINVSDVELCSKYVVGVVAQTTYDDELRTDDKLAKHIKDAILEKGASFVRVDESYLFSQSSSVSLSKAWDIKSGTSYLIVAFGITSSGEVTTEVAQKLVTTDDQAPTGDGNLLITTSSETATNIKVTVEKSADAPFEIYCIAPVAERTFESYYDGDYEKYATLFVTGLANGGYDLTQANNYYLFNSSVAINLVDFWDLESDCQYIIVAFGIDAEGSIVGDIATKTTSTTPFEDGYQIALSSVTPESYSITLTAAPQSKIGNYCVYAVSESDLEMIGYSGYEYDLARAVRDNLFYSGISFSQPDGKYIFSGNSQVTISQLRSSTNYTIVAFGVSSIGNIESSITCVETTTALATTVTGSLASIEVIDADSKSFDVTIDKGDFSGNYYVGVYSRSDFESYCNSNTYSLAEMFMEDELYLGTDLSVVDNTWVFDQSTTFNTSYSWICRPDTEYIVIAFGVNAEGSIVSNIVYTMAKTLPVVESENNIAISIHGITSNSATIEAIPSNDDVYFFSYLKKSLADSMSDDQIVDYMEDQAGQFFQYFLSVGYDTLYTTTILEPSTEYYAICYGWDLAISTELQRVSFTTLEDIDAPAIPSSIDVPETAFGTVEISEVTYESYYMVVEPAVEGSEYLLMTTAAANVTALSSDEEIVKFALNEMSKTGASIQSGGDIYDAWGDYVKPLPIDLVQRANVSAGYNYAMIVFGIDKETLLPTTECIVKTFSTPAGSPAATQGLNANDLNDNSPLKLKVGQK